MLKTANGGGGADFAMVLIRVAAGRAASLGGLEMEPESKPAAAAEAKSPDFEQFRFDFFEDNGWVRDVLDTRALLRLTGEERTLAEDMLIGSLPDARAVIGLSKLRSRRAEPQLLSLFEAQRIARLAARATHDDEWTPYILVWSAKALWRIDPKPRFLEPIIETLGDAEYPEQRETAAHELVDVPEEEAQTHSSARSTIPRHWCAITPRARCSQRTEFSWTLGIQLT